MNVRIAATSQVLAVRILRFINASNAEGVIATTAAPVNARTAAQTISERLARFVNKLQSLISAGTERIAVF